MATAVQTKHITAYEFLSEKPLPSLPSPTLTNPDMVLPAEVDLPALPSPPRSRGRPPSPSYLRDKTNDARGDSRSATPKKEKRGLMSRKMLLLRSRTGSGMNVNSHQQQPIPRSVPAFSDMGYGDYGYSHSPTAETSSGDSGSAYASSPTLMDLGNLAPEQANRPSVEEKRVSTGGSSFNSEELAGIPSFLAKYDTTDATTTDDEFPDSDSPAHQKYGYSVSIEGGLDAHRKQQEEDEHNSAILSKRAEQILANAKKRLNLMEGNLRGARDLVSPLTAANLKRASSLGSSQQLSNSSGRGRFVLNGYHYETPAQQSPIRTLHAQASSPTMGRDMQGHSRGLSETSIPPRAAPGRSNSLLRSGRIPVKTSDGSWTPGLRSSRSYDSIGSGNAVPRTVSRGERPLHTRSPDPTLEPLAEDDGSQQTPSESEGRIDSERYDALGIQRPVSRAESRTEDLREQMSSLKGKISNLKERAREDSLRRQSLQSLRTASPFSNALATPPKLFYTQTPTYGSPVLDTNAGVGRTSQNNSPATPQSAAKMWDQTRALTGSRNAFAEQAAQKQPLGYVSPERVSRNNSQRQLALETKAPVKPQHKRTASGTAIVEPASNRYSHHQYTSSSEMPGTYIHDVQSPSGEEMDEGPVSPLSPNWLPTPGDDHTVSEVGSVYEDAEYEQPPVVAHEDRDDAFDYEHFFLHSAMGSYSNDRRSSTSSEESVSSVETARGPTATVDDLFDPTSGIYPPPTPETPERLREIERKLHKRTLSDESVGSVDSFATAAEGLISPPVLSRQASAMDWPIPPSDSSSRASSRPTSRPSTAVKRPERHRDSSSERADSGVGFSRRSNSSHDTKRPGALTPRSTNTVLSSPPMSPKTTAMHDPATLAVNALLNPNGRQLGLKDKAMLFGLIESIRKVCYKLQEEDEGQYETRILRRRLDDAKRALDGTLERRPGT